MSDSDQTEENSQAPETPQVTSPINENPVSQKSLLDVVMPSDVDHFDISDWAQSTAEQFLGLMDIENVSDRRAALSGMKESQIIRLITIAQCVIDLQNEYSVEHNDQNVAMVAAKNAATLKAMKTWLGM